MSDELKAAAIKVGTAWAGAIASMSLTEVLQAMALIATIVYTLLQIYVLVRDRFRWRK
jgi:hypothetical protein